MAKKNKKAPKQNFVDKEDRYLHGIVYQVCAYLCMFMPRTLAVRLVCILFVACCMSNNRIAGLADCHAKTVRKLRKRMDNEMVSELMVIAPGSGRKPKVKADIKTQIIEKVKEGTFLPLADCRHDKDKLCPDDFGVCCLEAFERVQYQKAQVWLFALQSRR